MTMMMFLHVKAFRNTFFLFEHNLLLCFLEIRMRHLHTALFLRASRLASVQFVLLLVLLLSLFFFFFLSLNISLEN